jgi:hypothetical protein
VGLTTSGTGEKHIAHRHQRHREVTMSSRIHFSRLDAPVETLSTQRVARKERLQSAIALL